MFTGRGSQSWRIEIDGWDDLGRPAHRNMMRLAGEHGAEWWGGGRFEFHSSDHAFECVSTLRRLGLQARVVLRVSGPAAD
jgi:hypothetical protein